MTTATATPKPPGAQHSTAVVRAGALNLLARLVTGAAAFALAILTTHVLSVHGRGLYAILTTTAGIAVILLTAPSPVLVADLVHARRDEAHIRGGILALAALSTVLFVGAALAGELIGVRLPGAPYVQVATAVTSGILVYVICEISLAQGTGNVTWVGLGEVGAALLPFAASATAAFLGYTTVGALILAWLAGAALTALIQMLAAIGRRSFSLEGAPALAVGWLWRARSIAFSNSALQLCARIDVLVVSAVISVSAAGIYSIPVALAANVLLFPRALITVTYRSIMTAPAEDLGRRLGASLRGCAILVAIGGGAGIPLAAVTAGRIFGTPYAGIWQPLAILMPGIAGWSQVELMRHVLLTRFERQREVLYTAIGMTIANGVLAVVGSALFGLDGAAASTTITYLGAAVWMTRVCSKRLGVSARSLVAPMRTDLVPLARLWGVLRPGQHSAMRALDPEIDESPAVALPRSTKAPRRPRWVLLGCIPILLAIIGGAGGFAYSLTQATLYESQSDVVVSPTSSFLDPSQADSFPAITTTVQQIALTQLVLEDAAQRLGGTSFNKVRDSLRLSIDGDTPVLTIAAVAPTQSLASAIAAAETDALTHAMGSIPRPGLTLKVFSQAEERGKIQPTPSRNTLLGASAGFLVACFGLALLISSRRNRPLA